MNLENGTTLPLDVTLQQIVDVLKSAGVEIVRKSDDSIGVFLSYDAMLQGRLQRKSNPKRGSKNSG